MQIRIQIGEQIFHRRFCADRAGKHSAFAKSRVDGLHAGVVALYNSPVLFRRKGEHGVVHVERSCDLSSDQLFVRNADALGERISEQADPEAAVQVLRVRWSRSSMTHKKLM